MTPARILLVLSLFSAPSLNAQVWWSSDYAHRRLISVTTGPALPDKGYQGYTARLAGFDTAALVAAGELQADCDDLRLVYWDGSSSVEIAAHVIGCATASTDLRFALQFAHAADSTDTSYALYYGNPAATAPPPLTPTNVYLWFDDASADRLADYDAGRTDAWHGSGWQDSFSHNAAGYYQFDTDDNFTDSIRIPVDERDVYAEAEFFHTGCYNLNMTTGLIVRGIIDSGSRGSETASHYYATNRGHNATGGCDSGGYAEDGDIVKSFRTTVAVDGVNPPAIVEDQWRRQGLFAWSVNPTRLAFFDADDSSAWGALGYPEASALHVAGDDAADFEGRGFAGVISAQDRARLRHLLVRRYVGPEPVLTLGPVESEAVQLVTSQLVTTFSDPITGMSLPKSIPGSVQTFSIQTLNPGNRPADADSVVLTIALDARVALRVADFDAGVAGPVQFTDGEGAEASGLTYNFIGLGSLVDDLAFSTDGVNFDYTPLPDGFGVDVNVTHLRISPKGVFLSAGGADPVFTLRYKTLVP